MGEVQSINVARADRENDNTLLSPVECLEEAAREIRSGEKRCTSVLVLRLDAGEDGDCYDIGFSACNLRSSEMLSLLEVAKTRVLSGMGFLED